MLKIKNEELIQKEDNENKDFMDFVNYKKKNPQKPLIFFGAGAVGANAQSELAPYDIEITCFLDNDVTKQGGMLEGKPIYSYQEVKKRYSYYDIILADSYADEKFEQLNQEKEVNNIIILGRYTVKKYSYEYYESNVDMFSDFYNQLEDQLSRDTLLVSIKFNITGNRSYYDDLEIVENQYFVEGIIDTSNEEVFVDVGAYQGDTIVSFINFCSNSYKKIIAIEADGYNFELLNKTIKNQNIPLVEPFNIALYNQNTVLSFNACSSMGSRVIECVGNESKFTQVVAKTLDSLLNGEKVTFIKMDIEGGELAALEGSQETIRKYKPKLAICVYHKAEDILTIPQYIKYLVPEYKLFLRQHQGAPSELVLYAVI